MTVFQVTSISSKGQIVIPQNIRQILGVKNGTKLVILTDGKNLLLKPIKAPQFDTFKSLIKESRKIVVKKGLKQTDLKKLIKKVRNENRP